MKIFSKFVFVFIQNKSIIQENEYKKARLLRLQKTGRYPCYHFYSSIPHETDLSESHKTLPL